jgi:hypothetical protein
MKVIDIKSHRKRSTAAYLKEVPIGKAAVYQFAPRPDPLLETIFANMLGAELYSLDIDWSRSKHKEGECLRAMKDVFYAHKEYPFDHGLTKSKLKEIMKEMVDAVRLLLAD